MGETRIFRSNGKLLLSGEYLVLHGAKALAIPTKYGHQLEVTSGEGNSFSWSTTADQKHLFSGKFDRSGHSLESDNQAFSERLESIFKQIIQIQGEGVFEGVSSFKSTLDFPIDWGLGSSSTLINDLAEWAGVDSFALLESTFGGSGYDVACAKSNGPIVYYREDNLPKWVTSEFNPAFAEELFFVYLGQKMDSRKALDHLKERSNNINKEIIGKLSSITEQMESSESVFEFEHLMKEHEDTISELLDLLQVKESLFSDYGRSIKSLGAWGGDFILATGGPNEQAYFKTKGYDVVIPYHNMALN